MYSLKFYTRNVKRENNNKIKSVVIKEIITI